MAKEIREIIAFQEQLVAGDPAKLARLDDLRNAVNHAEKRGALAPSLSTGSFEFKPVQEPVAQLTPQDLDRQLKDALRPFVQEYQAAELYTPNLVNHTWNGIWKVIGDGVEFKYQVPQCDRSREELAQLRKKERAIFLLPDDIYTLDGLVRLGRAFPLMNSWVTDPQEQEATRISHSFKEGGSIDIEISPDAPYRTSLGYTEQELRDKIAADGRKGMRLSTYFVGSQFSQLLTGHYFDETTLSRIPESFCDGRALNARFDSDGSVYVYEWSPGDQYFRLGGRSEGRKT